MNVLRALLLLALVCTVSASGQSLDALLKMATRSDTSRAAYKKNGHVELARCIGCHNQAEGLKNLPAGGGGFCLLRESGTFDGDPHVRAWVTLDHTKPGTIAARMMKLLSTIDPIGDEERFADFRRDTRCTTCHVGSPLDVDGQTPAVGRTKQRDYTFGVTCQACHGPAKKWIDPHVKVTWRAESPDHKKSMGMIDVRNPITKSKLCYSCHIGSPELNRFVTHEMYAAGHPPLPAIELEAFSSAMPRHWRTLSEKPAEFESKKDFVDQNPHVMSKSNTARTRAVLVGAVMAVRQSALLVAESANRSVNDTTKPWPELAAFDCAACHHDLQQGAWRQQRGYATNVSPAKRRSLNPGRPLHLQWPAAILKATRSPLGKMLNRSEGITGYEEQLNAFASVLAERPFGEAGKLAAQSTGGFVAQLDVMAQELLVQDITRPMAHELLAALKKYRDEAEREQRDPRLEDFNYRNQLDWAIVTIEAELSQAPTELKSYPARPQSLSRIRTPFEAKEAQSLPLGYDPKTSEK